MKLRLSLTVLLGLSAFISGCGLSGSSEETVVAQVGSTKVYQSDIDYLFKDNGINLSSHKAKGVVAGLFRDIALVDEAKKEYPGVESVGMSQIEQSRNRMLASIYQNFYVMECLFHTDGDLKKNFDKDPVKYTGGDSLLSFVDVRSRVAEDMFILEHAQEFKELLSALAVENSQLKQEDLERVAHNRFISDKKNEWVRTLGSKLVEKYGLEIAPSPKQDPKLIFERDSSLWKTKPGLYVYHILMSDSIQLASVAKQIKTLDDFKAAAKKYSSWQETASHGGELGVVLENHSLPYGLGMQPTLFEYYKKNELGLSGIMRSYNPVGFALYYANDRIPVKQKSFARAKGAINAAIAAGEIPVDLNTPVVLEKGAPVLFEKDLQFVREGLNESDKNRYGHAVLASYIMEWYAFAKEAVSVGIESTWEYKAYVKSALRSQIKLLAMDSIKSVPLLSVESAKPYLDMYGDYFKSKQVEKLLPELSMLATIPKNEIRYEYFYGFPFNDLLGGGKERMPELVKGLKNRSDEFKVRRFVMQAEGKNKLVVSNSFFKDVPWAVTNEASAFKADSLFKVGKKSLARWEWSVLRALNSENDSLFILTTFELAKLEADDGNFNEALKEYSALCNMFPNSVEAEKGLFNAGFILDENLQRKADAAVIYRRFLKLYPNSEMAESVKWLLQNIESDGKLENDLVKSVEKSEK